MCPLDSSCPTPSQGVALSLFPLGKEVKWVSCQVWPAFGQGPMGTSYWTAQPWSLPHWLALGTQPRNNAAIHAAWALHNDPLGPFLWLDGV